MILSVASPRCCYNRMTRLVLQKTTIPGIVYRRMWFVSSSIFKAVIDNEKKRTSYDSQVWIPDDVTCEFARLVTDSFGVGLITFYLGKYDCTGGTRFLPLLG